MASYRISGTFGSTDRWRKDGKGMMTFGKNCMGSLEDLRDVRARYVTGANSKGE
jgi:hypothetical protein